ncbi:MAG: FHA domain-containing protein, partial [Myxococcales bacterium]|nr:FHA domain-containing protein [Myxococcales bacterium]
MARLLWRDAQGIEGSIDLASTEIRIGRAMDCAIRTDDAMVSRHHSRVFWGGGGYVLEDLSSANGVWFQEQRVQSHMFKHGDAVRCGSLWLR